MKKSPADIFSSLIMPLHRLYSDVLCTYRGCLSTLTLSILTLSRMTLSNVSFPDISRNDYLDHFDTFGENFDFDTFKNDTFENV